MSALNHSLPPHPLDFLNIGEWGEVTAIDGESAVVHRLAELGIRAGVRIQLLRSGSPLLVRVDNSRFSLRSDAAMHILVQPIPAAD